MSNEFVLPLLVLLAGAAYIFMPFLGDVSPLKPKRAVADGPRNSLDQLELDRELGKVDEREYNELRPALEAVENSTRDEIDLEALVFALRRGKRLDLALEAEIAISRRRQKRSQN